MNRRNRRDFEPLARIPVSASVTKNPRFSRRKFFGALGLAGGSALAGGAYTRLWEPSWLQIGRHQVSIQPNQAPIKILHLSDFHASSVVILEQIADSVRLGLSLKPDLVCLTGDFVTWKYDRFADYARALKPLSDAAPTFACLGNHDGGRWSVHRGYADTRAVSGMLEAAGVRLLHNASAEIRIGDRDLVIVGVGDVWAQELNPAKAFALVPKPSGGTAILLCHNPDSKDELAGYPWDLMLCGHTHGGQLVLPIIGRPFLPIRDARFAEGLHRWNDRWLHVTRGVGNVHGLRFNCPPEVSLLTVA